MPYGGMTGSVTQADPRTESDLDPIIIFGTDGCKSALPTLSPGRARCRIYSGHNVRSTVFLERVRCTARTDQSPCGPSGKWNSSRGWRRRVPVGLTAPAERPPQSSAMPTESSGPTWCRSWTRTGASPNSVSGHTHNVTWSPDPAVDNRESEGILATPPSERGEDLVRQGVSLDVMISFPRCRKWPTSPGPCRSYRLF